MVGPYTLHMDIDHSPETMQSHSEYDSAQMPSPPTNLRIHGKIQIDVKSPTFSHHLEQPATIVHINPVARGKYRVLARRGESGALVSVHEDKVQVLVDSNGNPELDQAAVCRAQREQELQEMQALLDEYLADEEAHGANASQMLLDASF